MSSIGQESITLIENEETGGEAYYNKTEQCPDWPGGASGVTVGCGYDTGYSTAEQIAADWDAVLPAAMVQALQSVAGIHGSPARSAAAALHGVVNVPWSAALNVFLNRDVPKWTASVQKDLANTDKLPPDCLGVIVSVAFNRGASFNLQGDHYREMRAIKADMEAENFADIPHQIRSMKRLWPLGTPDHTDLTARREHEAVLFEKALDAAAPKPEPVVEPAVPIALTPAPASEPKLSDHPGPHNVAWVQQALNEVMNAGLTIDDAEGPATRRTIAKFQALHELSVDSVVGPETVTALLVCLKRLGK